MKSEIKDMIVPVYLGDALIFELDRETTSPSGWQETKVLVCPYCLKSTTLGRDDNDGEFQYDSFRAYFNYDELKIKDEKGFRRHVRACKIVFAENGVCNAATKKQIEIAERFARFSRRETNWDFAQFNRSMIDHGARVFVFCKDGVLKGYVVFDKRSLREIGTIYVLCDIYTFPVFRKSGIATRLIDHGIEVLKIDRDNLGISFPIREAARNIVLNAIGKYVIGVSGKTCSRFLKEEL